MVRIGIYCQHSEGFRHSFSTSGAPPSAAFGTNNGLMCPVCGQAEPGYKYQYFLAYRKLDYVLSIKLYYSVLPSS